METRARKRQKEEEPATESVDAKRQRLSRQNCSNPRQKGVSNVSSNRAQQEPLQEPVPESHCASRARAKRSSPVVAKADPNKGSALPAPSVQPTRRSLRTSATQSPANPGTAATASNTNSRGRRRGSSSLRSAAGTAEVAEPARQASGSQDPSGDAKGPSANEPAAQEAPRLLVPGAEEALNRSLEQLMSGGQRGPGADHQRGADEEDDAFARNLSANASSALQGLLRKLGGFDDALPFGMSVPGMGSKVKTILAGLRSIEDEGTQLGALTELNELLLMGTEDQVAGLPVDSIVPTLVQALQAEHSPDVMLMAARAITNLATTMPPACGIIVRHGAPAALCARLLNIDYIDVAEQSLQALQKLSLDHAGPLLSAGALLAVLSYLDFFPSSVQRTATSTAANICRALAQAGNTSSTSIIMSNVQAVREAVPMLTGLLKYSDAKVVDHACMALGHVAQAAAAAPTSGLMEVLQGSSSSPSDGLVACATQLVEVADGNGSMKHQLGVSTYFGLLRLLAAAATSSAQVVQALLQQGLLSTLLSVVTHSPMLPSACTNAAQAAEALAGAGTHSPAAAVQASPLKTSDQLADVLGLLQQLLPPMQDSSTWVIAQAQALKAGAAAGADGQCSSSSAGGFSGALASKQSELHAFYASDAGAPHLQRLASEALPLVLVLQGVVAMPQVRVQCLSMLIRVVAVSPPALLDEAIKSLPISSLVGSLLGAKDAASRACGLHLAHTLMEKLPAIYHPLLVKEGVVHAIALLAEDKGAQPQQATEQCGAGCAPGRTDSAMDAAASASGAAVSDSARVTRSRLREALLSHDRSRSSAAAIASALLAEKDRRDGKASTAASAEAATLSAAPPSTMSSPRPTLRQALQQHAQSFLERHYKDFSGSACDTEGIAALRSLAGELHTRPSALGELLAALDPSPASGGVPISTFELLSSGAVHALLAYLQPASCLLIPKDPKDASPGSTDLPSTEMVQALTRLRDFAAAALPAGSGLHPPLRSLVRRLQGALCSSEAFPVILSPTLPADATMRSSTSYYYARYGGAPPAAAAASQGSLSSGLAALSHPLKLSLTRHAAETSLRDYSGNTVLIEPLATMSAIEDFLYPRVYRADLSDTARRVASHAAAVAASRLPSGAPVAAAGAASAAPAAAREAPEARGTQPDGAADSKPSTSQAADKGATRSKPVPVNAADRRGSGRSSMAGLPAVGGAPGEDLGRRVTRSQARAASGGGVLGAASPSAASPVTRSGSKGSAGSGTDPGDSKQAAGEAGPSRMSRRPYRESARAEGATSPSGPSADDGAQGTRAAADAVDMNDLMDVDGEGVVGGSDSHGEGDHEDEIDEDLEGDEEDRMHEDGEAMFGEDDEDFQEHDDEDDMELDIERLRVHDVEVEAEASLRAGAAAASAAASSIAAAAAAATLASRAGADAVAAAGQAAQVAAVATATATAPPAAPRNAWGQGSAASISIAREPAPPKLAFYVGSGRLASTTTVFQAIQQVIAGRADTQAASGEAEEEQEAQNGSADTAPRRRTRLWDEVHTLTYRLASDADAADAASADTSSALVGDNNVGAAGNTTPLPLLQLLVPRLPGCLHCSVSCRDVLQLLQVCEAVNRLAPVLLGPPVGAIVGTPAVCLPSASRNSAHSKPAILSASCTGSKAKDNGASQMTTLSSGHVGRDEFVNPALASKLGQQLKDVLCICGGGLPDWTGVLAMHAKFLFPLEVRKRYFSCTAFGLGRALTALTAQHAAEAGGAAPSDRELQGRIARPTRQKVRVSRKRILESAMKVMEMYGKSKAILELEYFGEAGSGLGPTLEFYTLLSHELQRKDLQMWRHEDIMADDAPADMAALQDEPAAGDCIKTIGQAPKGKAGRSSSPKAVSPAFGRAQNKAKQEAAERERRHPSARKEGRLSSGSRDGAAAAAPAGVQAASDSNGGDTGGHGPDEVHELVNAPMGLFPRPLPPSQRNSQHGTKVQSYFRLLGRTLGRALQDTRLVDLPLAPAFFAGLLSSRALGIHDVAALDPALGSALLKLAAAASTHLEATDPNARLLVDGVPVEDMCLVWALPGQADYCLVPPRGGPGGPEVPVEACDLGAYVEAVVDAVVGAGVQAQLAACRAGLEEILPVRMLGLFYEDELVSVLCGAGEAWTMAGLSSVMKFDHGYSLSSPPIKWLLEVMCELCPEDQRRFLRFVTGSPRLPPGGLAMLNPRLTVVRKHVAGVATGEGSAGITPVGSLEGSTGMMGACDQDLPSVMTCANYIKLPPYSCKAVLAERLMYAIREGQGSFDLS